MNQYIYFDSAATTAPYEEAILAASAALRQYGNPSSLHCAGIAARKMIDDSRAKIASAFSCSPDELIFTSSGTEASNMAIRGLAKIRGKRSKTVITTDSEHPSVAEALKDLEKDGFEIIYIPTKGGALDLNMLRDALAKPVAFLTIMQANNETGAVYDIPAVRRLLQQTGNDAPLHVDAVQSFQKISKNRLTAYCDLATLSAHKIGGIKGAGALYIRKEIHIPALLLGGGQEKGLRSGTENVAAIAAFGTAAEKNQKDAGRIPAIADMHDFLAAELSALGVICHIPESHLPNILHISIPGVLSSWALNALSEKGICVSAGSACSSRKKGNRVLEAYGLPKEEIETSLRISFTNSNTIEECRLLVEAIRQAMELKR